MNYFNAAWLLLAFILAASPLGAVDPASTVVVDTHDPGTYWIGSWSTTTGGPVFGPDALISRGLAKFAFTAPLAPGRYQVSLWWTSTWSRGSSVPVTVSTAEGEDLLQVNQQENGGRWNLLGNFDLDASSFVLLEALSYRTVCVDAVKFELAQELLPPAPAEPPAAVETFRFEDGFENADSLMDLICMDRWHNVQIEPSTNRVEVTSEKVHSGTRALKLVAASGSGGATKADIDRQLLTFKKGDEVYFSGWFYLVGGKDVSGIFLWDLESTQYYNAPGRRLYIQGGEYLASDLGKWLPEPPIFRQSSGKEVLFPKDRWCHVEIHLHLSEGSDGVMEVWQDGLKVIDGQGQTLPTAEAVYDRLQVGITANSNASAQTLYLDDIVLLEMSNP